MNTINPGSNQPSFGALDNLLGGPRSALDVPHPVTLFKGPKAPGKAAKTLSLREMAYKARSTTGRDKDTLPLWKFATFGDKLSAGGILRHDQNVLQVTGIEGDHDAGTMSAQEATDRLKAAGIAALVHTTPSHTPEAPRWRVLCPLANPVDKEARADLVAQLNGALDGALAPESFTLSQAFFYGSVDGQATAETHLVDGLPIDRVEGLPSMGKPRPGAQMARDDDDLLAEWYHERDWQPDRINAALGKIPADCGYDDWVRVGMALHNASQGSDAGFDLWHEWSLQSDKSAKVKGWESKWRSFASTRGKPVTIASLYDLAKGYGWNPAAPASAVQAEMAALLGESKPAASEWESQLDRDKEGKIKATPRNLALILAHDRRSRGTIAYDLFAGRIVLRRSPKLEGDFWAEGPLSDIHGTAIKAWFTTSRQRGGWGLAPTTEATQDAITLAARKDSFHPIQDWINTFMHDGQPRVDRLFVDYLGTPDRAYYREAARCWMVAAVARVFEPGHKFDFVPIIEGKQGIRKSTFVRVLGGDWAGDPTISHWDEPQKLAEQIAGFWLIEMGELAGMYRAEVNAMKAAITKTEDTARLPYARTAETRPRQCVFIGSTNESTYLRDPTGNRRFWPIEATVKQIDTDRLQRQLHQLWAEAVAIYRAMRVAQPEGTLPLHLISESAKAEALELQSSRKEESPTEMLAAKIVHWVDEPAGPEDGADDLDPAAPQVRRDFFCAASIWHDMQGKPDSAVMSKAEATVYGNACTMAADALGWAQGRESTQKYGRVRGYRRRDE